MQAQKEVRGILGGSHLRFATRPMLPEAGSDQAQSVEEPGERNAPALDASGAGDGAAAASAAVRVWDAGQVVAPARLQPGHRGGGELVVLQEVHVRKAAPPKGEKGLEWHRLTSLEVRKRKPR